MSTSIVVKSECGTYKLPTSQLTFYNTDLVLFLTYESSYFSNYIAVAVPCGMSLDG